MRSPLYISRDYGSTEGGEIRLAAGDTYPGAVIDLVGNGNEAILRFWNTNVNHVFEFNLTTGKFNFSGMTNKSSNGFTHCQGGIILQWGTVSSSNLGYDTVTFPITFSQLFSVITKSANRGSEGAGEERYIEWQNNSQFRAGHDVGGFNWFAVGV